jgi:hypothetical protein
MSSPWMDAAEYGRGLGDRLAEALIQLPAIRAKMAMSLAEHKQALDQQLWERHEKEKEFGIRQQEVHESQAFRRDAFKLREQDKQAQLTETKNRDDANLKLRVQGQRQSGIMQEERLRDARAGKQQQAAQFRQKERDNANKVKVPNKGELTKQTITEAQEIFKRYKNPSLARKYIKDKAQERGVTIDPFAVDFSTPQGQ